jgi:hypothetical protein
MFWRSYIEKLRDKRKIEDLENKLKLLESEYKSEYKKEINDKKNHLLAALLRRTGDIQITEEELVFSERTEVVIWKDNKNATYNLKLLGE